MTIQLDRPVQTPDDRFAAENYDGVVHIPDVTGDARIMWHKENAEEVAIAKAAFDAAIAGGSVMYKTDKKGKAQGEQIKEFDPEAEKIVAVKRLVGG